VVEEVTVKDCPVKPGVGSESDVPAPPSGSGSRGFHMVGSMREYPAGWSSSLGS
jgi:hypothetical protein